MITYIRDVGYLDVLMEIRSPRPFDVRYSDPFWLFPSGISLFKSKQKSEFMYESLCPFSKALTPT